jgi:hypothetical protein
MQTVAFIRIFAMPRIPRSPAGAGTGATPSGREEFARQLVRVLLDPDA